MIELLGISKRFQKNGAIIEPVKSLDWRVMPGSLAVVYGKSGSGKSTLLLMVGGMMAPTVGEVRIQGESLYALSRQARNRLRRNKIGFIFQKFNLLPYFTLFDNIALPLAMANVRERRERVLRVAEQFDLQDRLAHYPAELSVGQQQRVALARALVKEPDVILADEPTGNLDLENREVVAEALLQVAQQGKVVITVTHDTGLLGKAHQQLML